MQIRSTNTPIDFLAVSCLRALALFPLVRERAKRAGPSLFSNPAARAIAASLITGIITEDDPGPELRRSIHAWLDAIERCRVPAVSDEAWGLHLLSLLAEREHGALLASTLRWAADAADGRILAGSASAFCRFTLTTIRSRVDAAFAIASGDLSLEDAVA